MIDMFIPCLPIAQPRHKPTTVGKHARMYLPKNHPVHAYKQLIRDAIREEYGNMDLLEGPLYVALDFGFPRSNKAERAADPNIMIAHTKKPDIDNLEKAVLDALNGIVWHDDTQVTTLVGTKATIQPHRQPGVSIVARTTSQHIVR